MDDVGTMIRDNKQTLYKVAKWGIPLVACLIVAPTVFFLAKAMIGAFLALAAAGAIGLVSINMAPVLAFKLSNQKVKMIVKEAETNPVETLLMQGHEKRQAAEVFKQAITTFRTETKNFADQISGFKKEYPEDAARFENQHAAMMKLLSFREERYRQVQVELDNFDKAVQRASAMWKMSMAAQKMNKVAGMELGDPFEKIKSDAAVNSVMSNMNRAFSEMETALLDNKEIQQANLAAPVQQQMLSNQPSQTLPIINQMQVVAQPEGIRNV